MTSGIHKEGEANPVQMGLGFGVQRFRTQGLVTTVHAGLRAQGVSGFQGYSCESLGYLETGKVPNLVSWRVG